MKESVNNIVGATVKIEDVLEVSGCFIAPS